MLRTLLLSAFLAALSSRALAADLAPIVTTLTVPTATQPLATFTSAGASTSVIPGVFTTILNAIKGTTFTTISTLGDQTTVIPFTSLGVLTVTINTNTVIVSKIGLSTATKTSDDPATHTAMPAPTTSIASASHITNAPNLSSSITDNSPSTGTDSTAASSLFGTTLSAVVSWRTSRTSTTAASSKTAAAQSAPKAGLTSAQKAGIGAGAGVSVVFILIFVVVVILWRHGLLSRREHQDDTFDENEDFLHRPYSMLFNQKKKIEVIHDKPENSTQHMAYGSTARFSGVGISDSMSHEQSEEEPTYFEVSTHLLGQKRWSKLPQGEA